MNSRQPMATTQEGAYCDRHTLSCFALEGHIPDAVSDVDRVGTPSIIVTGIRHSTSTMFHLSDAHSRNMPKSLIVRI